MPNNYRLNIYHCATKLPEFRYEYIECTIGSAHKFYEMAQINSTEFQAGWGRIENYPQPNGNRIYLMSDFQTKLDKKLAKGYKYVGVVA